jgi:hypothetical protein
LPAFPKWKWTPARLKSYVEVDIFKVLLLCTRRRQMLGKKGKKKKKKGVLKKKNSPDYRGEA